MKLKAKDFYVLICDDSMFCLKKEKSAKMICGVFSSKKEAKACAEDVKDCLCKHYIKKCDVTVDI